MHWDNQKLVRNADPDGYQREDRHKISINNDFLQRNSKFLFDTKLSWFET